MKCSAASEGTCVDLLVLTPQGVWISAEVKRPGKRPTEGQAEFLGATILRGGLGVVVTSAAQVPGILAEAAAIAGRVA